MSFNIAHILTSMSPISLAILGVLVVMAIASVGVAVERTIAFSRSAKESKTFVRAAAPLLDDWKIEEVVPLASKYQNSALAKLFAPVVARYIHGFEHLDGGLTPVEFARNESERQREKVGSELRRGMNVLATVGSIAPFVGLLGTVVGIIAAFQGIGNTGSAGIAAVSTGIAEALVETAFGLMVAIPAVILFNYLNAKVAAIELALGRSLGELIDEMENHSGRNAIKHKRQAA
jgi:biopolymer transport protein ExbB